MSQGSESSEFPVVDSEHEVGMGSRVPAFPGERRTAMLADKILFPRHMLYVEAVLYLLIAATAFALGYFIGRNGGAKTAAHGGQDTAAAERVPVEGRVMLTPLSGKKRPDDGAVVIFLPSLPEGKQLDKPLPTSGFRPGDPAAGADSPGMRMLKDLGGAMARADAEGRFSLVVPRPGTYQILIISRAAIRDVGGPEEKKEMKEIGKYFASPQELLLRSFYRWFDKKVETPMQPIEKNMPLATE